MLFSEILQPFPITKTSNWPEFVFAGLFNLPLPLKEFGSFKTSMNSLNKDRCHSNKMSVAVALFHSLLLD